MLQGGQRERFGMGDRKQMETNVLKKYGTIWMRGKKKSWTEANMSPTAGLNRRNEMQEAEGWNKEVEKQPVPEMYR